MMKIKNLWYLLRETFKEWSTDKAQRLAAALSYYTIFSIPPLLVIVISLAGLIFGKQAVQNAILTQISGLLNPETAKAIGGMITSAPIAGQGLPATIVGILVLLLGASGVFGQLQDALNTIWEVAPKPGQGLIFMLRQRLVPFVMVLGVGFLLLVSMVITTVLDALSGFLQSWLPGSASMFQILNFAISFFVITLLFALMFKYVPDATIDWKDTWLGAGITSMLFTLGKLGIGLYLARSNMASTYGAAASLILILLWVYYSAQILFIGAEFTQVYANHFGGGIHPAKHARQITEDDRNEQGIPRKEGSQ